MTTQEDVLAVTKSLGYDADVQIDRDSRTTTVTANGKSVQLTDVLLMTPASLVLAIAEGLGEKDTPEEDRGVALYDVYDVIDKWATGLSDAGKSALSEHDVEALKMASWHLFQDN